MKLKIRELRALRMFINDKDIRYFLRGIRVDKDGYIVATDGHRMLVLNGYPTGEEFTIPSETVDKIVSSFKGKRNYDTYVEFAPNVFSVGNTSCTFETILGNYPDWRKVITENKQATRHAVSFNMQYLADVEKAFSLVNDTKETHLVMVFRGENGPAEIYQEGYEHINAYVMEKSLPNHLK